LTHAFELEGRMDGGSDSHVVLVQPRICQAVLCTSDMSAQPTSFHLQTSARAAIPSEARASIERTLVHERSGP
jgi:hypothetical protein